MDRVTVVVDAREQEPYAFESGCTEVVRRALPEIDAHLAKNGWHKSNHYCREYWYKRFPGVPRCACNKDKEGIQVIC